MRDFFYFILFLAACCLRLKPLDIQISNRRKMFAVAGEQGEFMFQCGGGDERIGQLQTVRQRIAVNKLRGTR